MSDQYGNHVDGEVWVPVKFDYVFATPTTSMEYALAFADGMLDGEGVYDRESDARRRLVIMREELKHFRIPEEYWPILMEREVSITRSSWKPMDV